MDFSYNNSALLDVILKHAKDTNFSGITVSGRRDEGERDEKGCRGRRGHQ